MKALRIVAPHFVAALILKDDCAWAAAPIIMYMSDQLWSEQRVRDYCAKKNWTVEELSGAE